MTTSSLRAALRSRLTRAMHERDRAAASALRAAIATLENAEAVATSGAPGPTTSRHVAGAAVGLGAAEAERRVLSDADERALLDEEIARLGEAESAFAEAGATTRAAEAGAAARLLEHVVAGVLGASG